MTPPQLTGNAPVSDILHPIEVGLAEAVGDELRLPILHHPDGLLGQGFHLHEPLGGDNRLHIVVAAAAGAHIVGVILHPHQVAAFFQILHNLLARLVAVKTLVFAAQLIDLAVVVQHPDDLQVVAQTHLEVVGVMGGGHLDATGAEFHFGVVIGNHGNFFVHQGQDNLLAHDGLVAVVIGVDANAAVAQHGLGTGGGHNDLAGAVGQGVADVPQVSGLIHILHLGIAQGGDAAGAPVDDAAALIDKTLFIQGDEDLPDGLGAALVHGEAGALPVAAGTQLLLLLHDAVAVLALPIPHPLQELFTSQVIAGQAFLHPQLFLHLNLGGDAGMVNAGNPQRIVALHSLEADEGVLHGCVHGVTHV